MATRKEYAYKRGPDNITISQMKRIVGFADSNYARIASEIGVTRAYIPRKVNEDIRRRKEEEERLFKETGVRKRVSSEHVTEALDARFKPIVRRIIEDPDFWDTLGFVLLRALQEGMLVPALKSALPGSAFADALKSPSSAAARLQLEALFSEILGAGNDEQAQPGGSSGIMEFLSFLSDSGISAEDAASLSLSPEDGAKASEWVASHGVDFRAFIAFVRGEGYKAWRRERERKLVEIMKLMRQEGISLADLGKAGAPLGPSKAEEAAPEQEKGE